MIPQYGLLMHSYMETRMSDEVELKNKIKEEFSKKKKKREKTYIAISERTTEWKP